MSMQIPTSILMKPIMSQTTTTKSTMNASQVNVDLLKLQKKGILNGEGGSSSAIVKETTTIDPNDKGKSIQVEAYIEEKKRL